MRSPAALPKSILVVEIIGMVLLTLAWLSLNQYVSLPAPFSSPTAALLMIFAGILLIIPDLVLVNPPRRGIGDGLCDYLNRMAPGFIIYSSCNARTMAKDIARLAGYRIERVQLFDMFPHTAHYEVLTLLVREV
ncbi:DUF1418 family protein [Klebsiella michiganensis]